MQKKTVIIAGGGPAGLTAAYEILKQSGNIKPIVIEKKNLVGGISATYEYKGNRIDLGGHRFFSKSDVVMDWWRGILATDEDPEQHDNVLLERNRLSRIYYLKKFFNYPISLSPVTIRNLGYINTFLCGLSYLKSRVTKVNEEKLDGFFINRFGKRLYETFFKDYTEKVWGVPCNDLSAEWGAQRVKGLSISKAVGHAISSSFRKIGSIAGQKKVETSLIGQFYYPKYGPGQLWEKVAEDIKKMGGEILMETKVMGVQFNGKVFESVEIEDSNGKVSKIEGDYFVSTLPVKDLIKGMDNVPSEVKEVAQDLLYRDFVTVGVLTKSIVLADKKKNLRGKTLHDKDDIKSEETSFPPDNWIYIQEPDVKVARLQIFNNWSPYMVADPKSVWVGMEYFCQEGDDFWNMPDDKLCRFAVSELVKMDALKETDVKDSCVIRVEKAYPCYFGKGYENFNVIREYIDGFQNMFLVGRNGMHRYNNQDHSMLSAMEAVGCILNGSTVKNHIWDINSESEYHEQK